jgi:mannose-6-phosphate isomerase-like protein (cupin superfamily)
MDSIEALADRARRSGHPYLEFLRATALSAGVYVVPPEGVDAQSPHLEDEIYFVIRGRARFAHQGSDASVGPGDVLFVRAHEAHHFHSVQEELVLLVVFGPAETPSPNPP